MLEDALRNDKYSPFETAAMILSFVQNELAADESSAITQFFGLYTTLCDRIFGPILNKDAGYRHKEGGWMSLSQITTDSQPLSPYRRAGNELSFISSRAAAFAGSTAAQDYDPIITLLGKGERNNTNEQYPLMTLIEAIIRQAQLQPNAPFVFPFLALSETTQKSWLAVLESQLVNTPSNSVYCTENDEQLFGNLLHFGMADQKDLQRYWQQKLQQQQQQQHQHSSPRMVDLAQQLPLELSPKGFMSNGNMYYSSVNHPRSSIEKEQTALEPNVVFSMLEYYLLLFIRYPMYAANTVYKTGQASRRSSEPYGKRLYSRLFDQYLQLFLPFRQTSKTNVAAKLPSKRDSETFLRLIIALWLESSVQIVPTTQIVRSLQSRQHSLDSQKQMHFDLHDSYRLTEVRYNPTCQQVLSCLKSLLVHLIIDPSLQSAVFDYKNKSQWCLTTTMSILQQPFYNLVRGTLRNAAIHTSGSPFYSVLDLWLLWLEPWNAGIKPENEYSISHVTQRLTNLSSEVQKSVRIVSIPGSNSPSKYQSEWQPYITANAYMYAIPFAIFVHRARELDFSIYKYNSSIQLIKRVFRVFTPDVVQALSSSLEGDSDLLSKHTDILGAYGPPKGPISLSDCQNDMQVLLEEIHKARRKHIESMDFLDRVGARLNDIFGHVSTSTETKAFERLVEQVRPIVGWPANYEVIKDTKSSRQNKKAKNGAVNDYDRHPDGRLTEKGRQQMLAGVIKPDQQYTQIYEDKMYMRVGTYEIPILVHLTIWLSDKLNEQVGIKKRHFGKFGLRFNLRFLADYRNLLFFSILYLIFRVIRWFSMLFVE